MANRQQAKGASKAVERISFSEEVAQNIGLKLIGCGEFRAFYHFDDPRGLSRLDGPDAHPEWAELLGLRVSNPGMMVGFIAEAEAANRKLLKEHGRYRLKCRGHRWISDVSKCVEAAYGKHRAGRIFTLDHGREHTEKRRPVCMVVTEDGSIAFGIEVRPGHRLWSGTMGFHELKVSVFGAAWPSSTKISAAACEKQLRAFLSNVIAVNGDDAYLYRIQKVELFGSYLKGADRCGDVDVAIEIEPRSRLGEMTQSEFEARGRALSRPSGLSIFEHCHWPYRHTMHRLKENAKRVLIKDRAPEPLHALDIPVTIYERGMTDLNDCLSVVLEHRQRWQSPQMAEVRSVLSELADRLNTDPEVMVAEEEAMERSTWDFFVKRSATFDL